VQLKVSDTVHWKATLYTESHRMLGVGRDLCGASSPTPYSLGQMLAEKSLAEQVRKLILWKTNPLAQLHEQ